jgi:hypothetical protein
MWLSGWGVLPPLFENTPQQFDPKGDGLGMIGGGNNGQCDTLDNLMGQKKLIVLRGIKHKT